MRCGTSSHLPKFLHLGPICTQRPPCTLRIHEWILQLLVPRWNNGEEMKRRYRTKNCQKEGRRVAERGVSKFLWPCVGKGQNKVRDHILQRTTRAASRLCACRCILCDPGSSPRRAFIPSCKGEPPPTGHQPGLGGWTEFAYLTDRPPRLLLLRNVVTKQTCAGPPPARWRSADAKLHNCHPPASR